MSARPFYGWRIVGATFVMALFSFGLGFYGITVYVASLQTLHGWSASTVSAPVTVYYVVGALLTASIARAYARLGPGVVVAGGAVAMALGIVMLGAVTSPWQLYPAFSVMALGWGAMSGAALNIIIAPWFERRRGLAVSIAFNGATLGGVLVVPGVVALIDAVGFARAVSVAASVMVAVLVPLALTVMRRDPEHDGRWRNGKEPSRHSDASRVVGGTIGDALRTVRFWSISAPFAIGLAAQVGLLTHLVPLLTPALGPAGAARAVSVATTAAIGGRLLTGLVVDRLDRRRVSSATLVLQSVGVALLAVASERGAPWAVLYAGCALFGLGVGNLTTLPGLILAVEWPRDRFPTLVALVVAINQFTFAFGPSMVGIVRDATGTYAAALSVCVGLQILAAGIVLLAPRNRPPTDA